MAATDESSGLHRKPLFTYQAGGFGETRRCPKHPDSKATVLWGEQVMTIQSERIRVGILMGGTSAERDVSLASGLNVIRHLDPTKFEVYPVEIGSDGKWYLHFPDSPLLNSNYVIQATPANPDLYQPPPPLFSELVTGRVLRGRVDVVLPMLHGPGGEDGSLQGYLETLMIPYVGSGVLASSLTMDKARCKIFLRALDLPTPDWIFFTRTDWERRSAELIEEILDRFPQGVIVKPNNQGSSFGMTLLDTGEAPRTAIQKALEYSGEVLVEQRIRGREFTCGVYGNSMPETLPVTEIRPAAEFFDYQSKYQPGGAEEITPAPIYEKLTTEIQGLAWKAHRALGCAGITRTDFLLSGEEPVIIEINTIPGMSSMSLIPKACQVIGLELETVLDRIIGEALFHPELITSCIT
jgi:D-alanine-D-alanine ligase